MSRESEMVVVKRDESGKPIVWCDPELVPIVKALNDAGIATTASCSGHGHQPGSIMLDDGTELRLFTYEQARRIDKMFPGINGEVPGYCAALDAAPRVDKQESALATAKALRDGYKNGLLPRLYNESGWSILYMECVLEQAAMICEDYAAALGEEGS